MQAAVLTGHGGPEMIALRDDWPVPAPGPGQVLVRITATAKNNTDRKVREGLYDTAAEDAAVASFRMAGDTLGFPRIQGADVVGRVAAVGAGVDPARVGERGLLDFNIYPDDRADLNLAPDYYGHGADGGFAEYGVFPSDQFHRIEGPLGDAELATLGLCAWQTALHMLTASGVGEGERIVVTGASGGVGTALIQLARLLGAVPYAVASPGKDRILRDLGAEAVIHRGKAADLGPAIARATGGRVVDAVMDLAGGDMTVPLLQAMCADMKARRTPPRLSIAGASAGNVTALPWTLIYLNQVRISGVSHGTRAEAARLIAWIRDGRLRPVLAGTMRLSQLREAEALFAARGADFVGKLVIVPDRQWDSHGAATELS